VKTTVSHATSHIIPKLAAHNAHSTTAPNTHHKAVVGAAKAIVVVLVVLLLPLPLLRHH
jgi:hypothetical protein